MQITEPRSIYKKLHSLLTGSTCRLPVEDALAALFEELSSSREMVIIAVDEVDQLMRTKVCSFSLFFKS